ncbi:hypothetical protein SAMD00019534_038990 [Acytostelium subglobosum LB1]|uniref:hypothetical protein n=1 Tax=Acytostelium subglobosum LB1 TaxID=1410327 RepID=UPI000644D770|nr:hypothetical protein SAMD00019534_038990 [Acytostelium subglobosum LB1]GAM20724.1 hypothetical protein SAMD00019534_038990 [Acytostelium subglobosum LB1]|eukprot:XP_012755858.1 hypothetical protein SAMD00019534_038990 [Acytostelium subglobosum LB1]
MAEQNNNDDDDADSRILATTTKEKGTTTSIADIQNSPKFLSTTQNAIRTPPLKPTKLKHSESLQSLISAYSTHLSINNNSNNTANTSNNIVNNNNNHSLINTTTRSSSNTLSSTNKMMGFRRSTSHQSFLEDELDDCSPIHMTQQQKRFMRNDRPRSSPPLSPSLLCNQPHTLIPDTNNNGDSPNGTSSISERRSPSISRGRSNSFKNIIYSQNPSRSPSITPTSSPSPTCKIAHSASPPIPIVNPTQLQQQQQQQHQQQQAMDNSPELMGTQISVLSTPISSSMYSHHSLTTPVTPTTPISMQSKHVTIDDFDLIEKIGEGGFGQVFLAKKIDTGEILALKRMSKDLVWSKNKVSHIKNERDILAQGRNHRWIVSLVYSFQDDQHLYLAMEYVAGGDLRSLLSALGCLEEENSRFYMAEMVEAVDACHQLGYCHRDLKPENFLIDKTGHIKLADFGLSKMFTNYVKSAKGTPGGSTSSVMEHTPMKFSSHMLSSSVTDFSGFGSFKDVVNVAYSVVGSPFYMAPEVLEATTGYGDEVDWWSLGCMFYEFVCGIPPFDGDSPEEVMETVLDWKANLQRPPNISDELWNLISCLITDGNTRLGRGERGVENIKNHPFFTGVDWGKLHENEPPFVPLLSDEMDTTYFEKDRTTVVYTNKNSGGTITSSRTKQNRNILGFTYPRLGEDPLVWANMVRSIKSAKTSSARSETSSKQLRSSSANVPSPRSSGYHNQHSVEFANQESTSPYGSYSSPSIFPKFNSSEFDIVVSADHNKL